MTGGLVQMIQLIGTEELTLAFFKAYAPHLEVDDIEPGLTPIRRANLLFKKM